MTPTTSREAKPVAGKSRLLSGGKKRERGRAIKPAFFVLARLGSTAEEQPYGVDEPWQVAFSAVAPQLIELLIEDRQILSFSRRHAGKCLVLAVETDGFPPQTAIVSVKALKANLKPLLAATLKVGASTHPRGPLLGGEDLPHGQLFGTMLLLEDVKAAKAYCDRITRGELDLPDERIEGPKLRPERNQPLQAAIAAITSPLPRQYSARRLALTRLGESVRIEIAAALEEAFNTEAASRPQSTYEEKQALSRWVNAELREFGLALRCPKTGKPSLLMAHPGTRPLVGRFQFDHADERGVRVRSFNSVTLPHLNLVLADLTRTPYGQHSGRSR